MFTSVKVEGKIRESLAKAPGELTFKPGVNLLAGPNGSGKSRLMWFLRKYRHHSEAIQDLFEFDIGEHDDLAVNAFDFEKDNPRVKSLEMAEADGSGGFAFFFSKLQGQTLSHGEFSRFLLGGLQPTKKRSSESQICFFDEPDQALDRNGVKEFEERILSHPWRQVFVATHSPYLLFSGKYHVIEMVPGYLDEVRKELLELLTRQAEL